jgi:hypothetical protein
MDETPPWAMPWVRPSGDIARAVLAKLDRPLRVWQTGFDFDAEEYYTQFQASEISSAERKVRETGRRMEWRMERVWQPDEESPDAEIKIYETGRRLVDDVTLNPRCLDDYVTIAYDFAGYLDGEPPAERPPASRLASALAWSEAGVCVLQQSLPWPFIDCLPYNELDNRPAHRLLYVYARLLATEHPRKAQQLFRAMLFMNPPDNMGARYHLGRHSLTDPACTD